MPFPAGMPGRHQTGGVSDPGCGFFWASRFMQRKSYRKEKNIEESQQGIREISQDNLILFSSFFRLVLPYCPVSGMGVVPWSFVSTVGSRGFRKNHMIPYQDTCIRFMKTAEPFSYKKVRIAESEARAFRPVRNSSGT